MLLSGVWFLLVIVGPLHHVAGSHSDGSSRTVYGILKGWHPPRHVNDAEYRFWLCTSLLLIFTLFFWWF